MKVDQFKLDKAFFLLEQGYILHVNTKNGGGEIWKGEDYFRYRHYGSSAIKQTKEELAWLFENIFKSDDFVVFQSWREIDFSYQCNKPYSLWIFSDGEYDGYNSIV